MKRAMILAAATLAATVLIAGWQRAPTKTPVQAQTGAYPVGRFETVFSPSSASERFLVDTAKGTVYESFEIDNYRTALRKIDRIDIGQPQTVVKDETVAGRYRLQISPLRDGARLLIDTREGRVWSLEHTVDGSLLMVVGRNGS